MWEKRASCETDAVAQFDDVQRRAAVPADRAGRGAAAEPDDQRALRVRVQGHRQLTDGAMQLDHVRPIVGLVQAVDEEDALLRVHLHHDRRLGAVVAPRRTDAAAVPAGERDVERIRRQDGDRDERCNQREIAADPEAAGRGADEHGGDGEQRTGADDRAAHAP